MDELNLNGVIIHGDALDQMEVTLRGHVVRIRCPSCGNVTKLPVAVGVHVDGYVVHEEDCAWIAAYRQPRPQG